MVHSELLSSVEQVFIESSLSLPAAETPLHHDAATTMPYCCAGDEQCLLYSDILFKIKFSHGFIRPEHLVSLRLRAAFHCCASLTEGPGLCSPVGLVVFLELSPGDTQDL